MYIPREMIRKGLMRSLDLSTRGYSTLAHCILFIFLFGRWHSLGILGAGPELNQNMNIDTMSLCNMIVV